MRRASRAILILLLIVYTGASSGAILPEGWSAGIELLLNAEAAGHWSVDRLVPDSTCTEASIRLSIVSEYADILAIPVFTSEPSPGAGLRRARALVRWPGTPWIGAGVFYGEGAPFMPGLSEPYIEHGWIEPDSLKGFNLSSGGFLGFHGEFSMAFSGTDTLALTRIRSPWMGFAGLEYRRTALHVSPDSTDGAILNTLTVWGDLRYVEPWVVIAGKDGEPGMWAVEGELRDFTPFHTDWGEVELVPGFRMAGSEFQCPGPAFSRGRRTFLLSALVRSSRYFAGAGLTAFYDLDEDSLSGAAIRAGMLSRTGLSVGTEIRVTLDGELIAAGSFGTTTENSSASLEVRYEGDSTRVTGMAAHSPRSDVTGELTVSGNAYGTVNPVCRLDLSTSMGPASGHLALVWEEGDVRLSAELRGYFE